MTTPEIRDAVAWIDEKALDIAKQIVAGREVSSQVLAWMQLAAIEALKLGLSGVGAYGDSGGYVAGSVYSDQDRECWVAEIQTTGGYEIAAHVYATSEADALHKQTAVLNALSNPPADGWRAIESAPHACHVLAARFDDCEWVYQVVMSPPIRPFTHWMPLPSAPLGALEGDR